MRTRGRQLFTLDSALVLLLTLAALALRLHDLGRESLWLDEAGRVAIAAQPLADISHAVRVVELSPPLYHVLLHAWMAVAGGQDFTVRLLSVLLVILAVPLAWSLGSAFGGRSLGFMLAVFVAFAPFAVHFGQEAAMYALLLPLGIVTTRAALGVFSGPRSRRPAWLAVYVVAGALALYTHYYAALLLASTGLVGLAYMGVRRSRHGLALWVAANVAIVLVFLPWLPTFLAQAGLAASVEDWSGIAIDAALASWAGALLADGQELWSGALGVGVLVAGVALGAWRLWRDGPAGESADRAGAVAVGLLLALTLVPLIIALLTAGALHSFRERGFLVVAPATWLLLAAGVVYGRRRGVLDLSARAVLGLLLALATLMGLQHHGAERKEEWRKAAAVVAAGALPDAPIFFIHFGAQLPFDRYFGGTQPRIGLPDSFEWEDGYTARYRVTPDDIARRVGPALEGRRQAWAVLSHDGSRGSEHLLDYLDQRGTRTIDLGLFGLRVIGYRLAMA